MSNINKLIKQVEKEEGGVMWWAYRHTNGGLHIKRYFGPDDFVDARQSPFVDDYDGPICFKTHDEAKIFFKKALYIK